MLYVETPKDYTDNLLKLITEFSKVVDTGPTYKNYLYFYILAMNKSKMKLRK